jgi:hypothetical protein
VDRKPLHMPWMRLLMNGGSSRARSCCPKAHARRTPFTHVHQETVCAALGFRHPAAQHRKTQRVLQLLLPVLLPFIAITACVSTQGLRIPAPTCTRTAGCTIPRARQQRPAASGGGGAHSSGSARATSEEVARRPCCRYVLNTTASAYCSAAQPLSAGGAGPGAWTRVAWDRPAASGAAQLGKRTRSHEWLG